VADLFHLDLRLFGIHWHGQVIPLHEFLFQHFANPFWDLVCGVFYLAHVPMAVIFLLIFWRFRSAELAGKFSMAFMIMNIMAFLTYYFYPAAAPWYVAKYGFLQPVGLVAGDPAGLARFDHLLGIDLFSSNYKISPVTFGAVPSMHVGVSTLIMLFSFHLGKKWGALMGLYVVLMGFSALYLQHHYTIDLIWGASYALVSWLLTDKIFFRWIEDFFRRTIASSQNQEIDELNPLT
jgi:inositol phosphorylceramide synthase catalytic subunit